MSGSYDDVVSAIGIAVKNGPETWLVPRRSHQDGSDRKLPANNVGRDGIRLTGTVPITDPGTVIAIRGRRDGKSLRVSSTRIENVFDIFSYRPAVKTGVTSVFTRPRATSEQQQWEEGMLREGHLVSRKYVRAVDGSWRVVVAGQNTEYLRPQFARAYGDQLALIELDWSRKQLEDARQILSMQRDEWDITTVLDGTSHEGVTVLRIGIREATLDIRAWHQDLPSSMVELFPFLAPSGRMDDFEDLSHKYGHIYGTSKRTTLLHE